jgi:hypothetical protein
MPRNVTGGNSGATPDTIIVPTVPATGTAPQRNTAGAGAPAGQFTKDVTPQQALSVHQTGHHRAPLPVAPRLAAPQLPPLQPAAPQKGRLRAAQIAPRPVDCSAAQIPPLEAGIARLTTQEAAIAPMIQLADAIVAAVQRRAVPDHLMDTVNGYLKACHRAERRNSPEQQLQALAKLRDCARALEAALRENPLELDRLYDTILTKHRSLIERALNIDPETPAQRLLHDTIQARPRRPRILNLLASIEAAHALLTEVAVARQAPAGEANYARWAMAEQTRAEQVRTLPAPGSLTPERRQQYAAAVRELDSALSERPNDAAGHGHEPDPSTRERELMRTLANRADAVLDVHRTALKNRLEKIDRPGQYEALDRCLCAIALVKDTYHTVLASLPVELQIDLLERTRAVPDCPSPDDFELAQVKLYAVIQLQPAFLEADEEARQNVISRLIEQHRAVLSNAYAHWGQLPLPNKLHVIQLVASAHSEAMGFQAPTRVRLIQTDANEAANWSPDDGTLQVNERCPLLDDFEHVMDTVFHENTHNWQHQLAAELRAGAPVGERGRVLRDPRLHTQARLFELNLDHDCKDPDWRERGYRVQPVERHAFHTGPRFARDLMRVLDA